MLQRTAFDPERTADSAETVLGDSAIRRELVDLIADAAAPQMAPLTAEQIKNDPNVGLNTLLGDPATAGLMATEMAVVLHDAHARLIGARQEPVQITDQQMRNIVRNEAVIGQPAITLPVPEVGVLSVARQVLTWLVPASAIAAVVFGVIGLTAHPDRSALLRSLGFGMLLLAVLIALLGYVLPKFALPAMHESPWARIPARLADDALPLLIAVDVILLGGGAALLACSGILRRRRRWSTPVSTYRYNEERRWS
jgi:hypothetical protein